MITPFLVESTLGVHARFINQHALYATLYDPPGTITTGPMCGGQGTTFHWDAATGASIIDLLFEMNAEAGTTLVLVTHDEALAKRCGTIIRLVAGRIVTR